MLALLFMSLMLLGACNIIGVRANFEPGPVQVTIVSPKSYGNNANPVLLNISAMAFLDPLKGSENRYITYSVDGKANVSMTPVYQGVSGSGGYSFSSVTGQVNLPNLPDGWHAVMVHVKYDYGTWINEGSARIEFAIGKPTTLNPNAPFVKVEFPTYTQVFPEKQPIPYFINISIPSSWFGNTMLQGEISSVSYVLDNARNITAIAGSDTSKGSPHGPIVINGSTPAYIPVFTVNYPTIILTGTIPAQSLGNHTLHILVLWSDYEDNIMTSNFQTSFSVSDKISQPINVPQLYQTRGVFTVFSPENQTTYNNNQVPITYSVDSKVIWSYYALDTVGQPESSDWKSFNGNITLSGLSAGSHKLVISVKTEANTPSIPIFEQTISFNTNSNFPIASNPTSIDPTPPVPELSWIVILPLLLTVLIMVAIRSFQPQFKQTLKRQGQLKKDKR
jgi:hypothetical protein